MSAPEQEWTLQDAQRFLARHRPDLCATEIDFLRGGYWNDVFKINAATGAFVLKRYRRVLADSLFPNLPDDEALALQRLAGREVAPDFVGYWRRAKVLLYRYVEGGAWKGDPAPVATLLRRKEAVGCEGFRKVPLGSAEILEQGDRLFERCAADELASAFKRHRPEPKPLAAPKKLSLIHTDIGAGNLIGADGEFRIIDWQCPAAGDLTEDVYSFLSPAFQILNHCDPIDEAGVSRFFSALDRPAIVDRYRALRPAFAYRMGGYCCLRLETAPAAEASVIERYVRAAEAEFASGGAMIIDLSIHSFSLWHHFRHAPYFDAIAYIDLVESLGFTGVNLSLNDANYRHLGGRETWRIDRVKDRLARSSMSLEIDTSGTEPEHLRTMIGVAHRMGAGSLRTYTRHRGAVAEMAARTAEDLRECVAEAQARGVTIVLENHEDFTGPELAAIVEAVNHPRLKILYDYGNSQMVLEDPQAALTATLAHVRSVHVKDHVMIRPRVAGRLTVAGVPMGEGFLPIRALTRRLLDAGLRRLTFENVWAYSAPVRPDREPLAGVTLGEGSFRYLDPPYDPARIVLDQSEHSPQELVRLERAALERGSAWFKDELKALGVAGFRAEPRGADQQ